MNLPDSHLNTRIKIHFLDGKMRKGIIISCCEADYEAQVANHGRKIPSTHAVFSRKRVVEFGTNQSGNFVKVNFNSPCYQECPKGCQK